MTSMGANQQQRAGCRMAANGLVPAKVDIRINPTVLRAQGVLVTAIGLAEAQTVTLEMAKTIDELFPVAL